MGKAAARELEEAERRRRARDKLASYLRHCRPALRDDAVWEEWAAEHEREPELRAVRNVRVRVRVRLRACSGKGPARGAHNTLGGSGSTPGGWGGGGWGKKRVARDQPTHLPTR